MKKKTGGRGREPHFSGNPDGYPKQGNTLLWQSLFYPLPSGYSLSIYSMDTNYPHLPISSIACYQDF